MTAKKMGRRQRYDLGRKGHARYARYNQSEKGRARRVRYADRQLAVPSHSGTDDRSKP